MFVKPSDVIKNMKIEPGMVVADFGAGAGHYTFEASERVGKHGKVYAIDVQKDSLSAIKNQALRDGKENIEIIWSDLEAPQGSRLATGAVDVAIISNILFQLEDKSAMVAEAFRVLKNGGRVAVIEWTDKIKKEEVEKIFADFGFYPPQGFDAGDAHYGLLFEKP